MSQVMTDSTVRAAREAGEDIRQRRWPRRIAGRRQRANVGGTERIASMLLGAAAATAGTRLLIPQGRRRRWRRGALKSIAGATLASLGALLTFRGVSGHSLAYRALGIDASDATARSHPLSRFVHMSQCITINQPAEKLYRQWRDIEALPQVFRHIKSARKQDGQWSHWIVSLPNGRLYEWDSQAVETRPNELIAWASRPDASVPNFGEVRFAPATGGRGTVMHLSLHHRPPNGALGALGAKLAGRSPEARLREELRRFKQWMEAGEITTTTGQPRGRCA